MFEQASALASLLQEWHITQEEAAKRLGISQSYLANKLRLLKLSPQEQNEILEYKLTERHARRCYALKISPSGRSCCAKQGEAFKRLPDRGAGGVGPSAQGAQARPQAPVHRQGHPPVHQHHRPRGGRHEDGGDRSPGGEDGDRGIH